MNRKSWFRALNTFSDNLKSAIQNLKWPGLRLIAFVLAGAGAAAQAQPSGKAYRIGYLSSASSSPISEPGTNAFRQGLRELGYVEGQDIVIEYRFAEGKPERLPDMVAQLVRLKVNVIVTRPQPPTIAAAKQATRTIPIVMMGSVVDPVEAGFVASLAKPGGNVTGLTNIDSELHGKRLGLLKEAFPKISRVAILWPEPQQKQAAKEIEIVRQAVGVRVQSEIVAGNLGLDGLKRAIAAIDRERPDALLVASSQVIVQNRASVIAFAAKNRLPSIYAHSQYVDAGGLMSYGSHFNDIQRRAATYVDKILRGANPVDLPVERPTKFEFVVNLRTAKQIGLAIPPNVLVRADKVIK
jgi:putative ABC transport system substrate-binding protein